MGGRFGKYGDTKRRQALRQMRREKFRLESDRLRSRISRGRRPRRPPVPDRGRGGDPGGADRP